MKIVLDTNVFISGVFFTGPPFKILEAWRDDKLKINVIKLRDRFIGKSVSPLMKLGFSGKFSPWSYRDNRTEE